MNEYMALTLIAFGILFDLLGCVGLMRLPDIYTRLQAATKTVTLGTCLILIGIFVYTGWDPVGVKALLCMLFVLVTSPTAAHAIARAAHRAGIKLGPRSVVDRYSQVQGERGTTGAE